MDVIDRIAVPAVAVLLSMSLAGCGDSGATPEVDGALDAGPDSALQDASDPFADAYVCGTDPVCQDNYQPYELRAEARDLGPNGRFVSLVRGGLIVGSQVRGGGFEEPVVLIPDRDTGGHVVAGLAQPATEALQPCGALATWAVFENGQIQAMATVFGYAVVVMACTASTRMLYGVPETGPIELEPIPDGEIPEDVEIYGMMEQPVDPWLNPGYACAFGDGIHCFNGADWEVALDPGGPMIYDMDSDTETVAVGEGGTILFADPNGWEDLSGLTTADLIAVDMEYTVAIGASDGTLILGDRLELTVHQVADEPIVGLRWSPAWAGKLRGVVESGCILLVDREDYPSHDLRSFCFEPFRLPGPARGISFEEYGMCSYWLAATPDQVYRVIDGCAE